MSALYDEKGKKRKNLVPIEKYRDIPNQSGVEMKTFRKTVNGRSIKEKYMYKTDTRLNKWDMERVRLTKYKKKGD